MKLHLLAAVAVALAATHSHCQTPAPAAKEAAATKAPTLKVGDKAPALAIEKWVKGAPVPAFEKGKVYMVEFWATWCGPCVASMPHITEVQKKYREQGLTVIGVTSLDKDNSLEKVEKMVADKGDAGMGYTVAWDSARKTDEAFMKAAGKNGIPCSYLIDRNGYVAYIGHPMRIDAVLEQVVAGKHDIAALAAKYAKQAENEAKANAIQADASKAMRAKDWDKACACLDQLVALDPEQFSGAAGTKFRVLAVDKGDVATAQAFATQVLEGFGKDNAQLLNQIAWTMVDPEAPIAKADTALALRIAERAVELGKRKDGAILDTLARVHFVRGEVDKAIAVETEAVALDANLKDTLEEYKAAKDGKKVGN